MPQSSERDFTIDNVAGGSGGDGGAGETGGSGGNGGSVSIVYNSSRANFGQQKIENDAEGKIWSIYMIEALVHDKALVERWRESMNSLLIFAGLFSATVTAFIIQSYPNLQPKPDMVVLTQISNQLTSLSSQASATVTNQAPFRPKVSDIRVNVFWFLSLGCALGCALSATLADQWARNYLQAAERPRAAHRRAKIRSYLHEGRKVFRMSSVLEAIPMLMHLSVFLFFAGIFDFMLQINAIVAYLCLGIFGACFFLYAVASVLPVMSLRSPYRTPLSSPLWYAWTILHGHSDVARNMILARDNHAVSLFDEKQMKEVLGWTVGCLTDDAEFEQFVEGIPGFLDPRIQEDSEKALTSMGELVCDNNLGHRILLLLKTCKDPKVLPPNLREHRITTCMNALWSLTVSIRPEHQLAKNLDRICNEEALTLTAYFAVLSYPNPQETTSCVVRTFTTIVHHLLRSFDSILRRIKNERPLQASTSEELLRDANHRARLALRAVTWLANLTNRYQVSENSISSARKTIEAVTNHLTHHYGSQITLGVLQTHHMLTSQVGRVGQQVNTAQEAMASLLSLEKFLREARFELLIFYVGRLDPETSSGSTKTISMIVPEFDFPDQDIQLRVVESLEQLILRWKNVLTRPPELLDSDIIQQREAVFTVIDSLLEITQRLNNMNAISKLRVLIEGDQHLLSPATRQRAHKVLQSLDKYGVIVTQGTD